MATTTPHGTRSVKPNFPAAPGAPSNGTVSPCKRLASSADRVKVWTDRLTSARDSARFFPSSRVMVLANSSVRASIRSAAFLRIRWRSYPGSFAIAFAPRTALSRVRSTSPRSARGTVSTTLPSYGFRTSIFFSVSIHRPATYISIATSLLLPAPLIYHDGVRQELQGVTYTINLAALAGKNRDRSRRWRFGAPGSSWVMLNRPGGLTPVGGSPRD